MRDEEDGDEKQAIVKHFAFQPNEITATKNKSVYWIHNIHNTITLCPGLNKHAHILGQTCN